MKLTQQMLTDSRWYEIIISKSASSALSSNERNGFIEVICKHNILLAARCKTNFHLPEPYLENIITSQAIKNAKTSIKPGDSALGFQALAEIGQFEAISNILKTSNRASNFNASMVANFVSQASEEHIFILLKTLFEVDLSLFNKAIDKLYQIEREFSFETRGKIKNLLDTEFKKFHSTLLVKVVATFKIQSPSSISPNQIRDLAFKNNLVNQAIDIINIHNLHNDFFYENYIEKIFTETRNRNGVQKFIEYIREQGGQIELKWLLLLGKNPNYLIKNIAVNYVETQKNISPKYMNALIEENINLNLFSSIKYACDLIIKHNYQLKFSLKDIAGKLIALSTVNSLSLAFDILDDIRILNNDNINLITHKLLEKRDFQAIKKAVLIIEQFDRNYKNRLLDLAISLKTQDPSSYKTAKDIITKHVSPCDNLSQIKKGDRMYAVVLSPFRGVTSNGYSLQLGALARQVFVPHYPNDKRLKSTSIVEVKIIDIITSVQKLQVEVINRNVESERLLIQREIKRKEKERLKLLAMEPVIGSVVECTVTGHVPKYVFLKMHPSKKVGVISEKDILKIIAPLTEISVGLNISAKISGYGIKDRFNLEAPN